MPSATSLQDCLLKRAVPRPVAGHTPGLRRVAPGVWTLERMFRHFGSALLPSNTTVLELASGSLAVVSPPVLFDSAARAALDDLGTVDFIIVPNSFHYLGVEEFCGHYPDATCLLAPELSRRVPELTGLAELNPQPPAAWAGHLEHLLLQAGPGTSEVVLFHRASATLVLTDLAFHMTSYPRALDRVVWQRSGIPRGFGPGRTTRTMLLADRQAAGHTLAEVSAWPFERIVVAHGDPIEEDAAATFARAFIDYLPAFASAPAARHL